MREKLDFFYKNNALILIPKDKIESGYWPLEKKYIYKVKYNIERNISRIKTR